MAQYYFISQLPSLDGISENVPLPITEDRFFELCHRFLGKKAQSIVEKITLVPPRDHQTSDSALLNAWNKGERDLRLALGKIRADEMKKSFDTENQTISADLIKTARAAVDMESPLEAEKFLSHYRLDFLESLRPTEPFSEEAVFYYGLKLKLLLRIRQFDADVGKAAYRNIYNSIINGDSLEAAQ